jgi:CARDB/Bacterial SH3 domain/Bacterial Ig domain
MPGRSTIPAAIGLLALIAASLACNAQVGSSGTPVAVSEASVVFIAPDNNSVIAEGSTITLAVNAADTAGVGRIEFRIDDNLIGTQNAPSDGLQTNFTARQPWIAQGIQGHLVVAVAFHPDGKPIGEAKITFQVVTVAPSTATETSTLTVTETPTMPSASATTAASPTLAPSNTPVPPTTAAPGIGQQPTILVTNPTLNIRSGPGVNYQKIGELKQGDTATIIGRNADSSWWVIHRNDGTQGWIINQAAYIQIVGDTSNVPLAASPPTPVPAPATPVPQQTLAPTSTVGAVADLVIDSIALNPSTPVANQTFNVTIVIRNQGTVDAGTSLVVGVFQPGNERSPVAVPAIPAGQTVTINMPVTLHSSGPNQTAVIRVDDNGEINEGPNGEANNARTITYNVN